MLVDKKTTPFVAILKLTTGEEIIASIREVTDTEYMAKSPLQMVMSAQGAQFAPWMMMADPAKTVPIKRAYILAEAVANPGLESQYESITTGIALPQKSSIITA
jgi:hypothetical protein